MSRFLAILVLSFFPTSLFAQTIIVAENPVPANSFAEVKIKLESDQSVSWDVHPEPTKVVESNETVYFNGPANTYKVTASIFWVEDKKVKIKKVHQSVVIGKAPKPPDPDPIIPDDSFTVILKIAFDKETAAEKAIYASKLASIYRVAATSTVKDPNIKTNGQLFDTMMKASRALLPDTGIPLVRRVIGERLNPIAGAASSPIDRTKLESEFKAIAAALDTLK